MNLYDIAIAKRIAGGGGSNGSNVLGVKLSFDGQSYFNADKTPAEIVEAFYAGKLVYFLKPETNSQRCFYLTRLETDDSTGNIIDALAITHFMDSSTLRTAGMFFIVDEQKWGYANI